MGMKKEGSRRETDVRIRHCSIRLERTIWDLCMAGLALELELEVGAEPNKMVRTGVEGTLGVGGALNIGHRCHWVSQAPHLH